LTSQATTGTSGSYVAWRDYVRDRRRLVFWPGPWRIGEDSADQLIGRADDSARIRGAIFERNLVVLSGDSGVGKSSLLDAGIVPGLRRDGFTVAVCNNWVGVSESDATGMSPEATSAFLASKLAKDLPFTGDPDFDGTRLVERLDAAFGSKAVLVLDQFEELIRQQPELYWSVRKWVERVIDETRVRVVISLRAEYAHHLNDLDVSPYRRLDWIVDPIRNPDDVERIIRSGCLVRAVHEHGDTRTFVRDPSVPIIEDDAVDELRRIWVSAGGADGSSRIRLLHLQAALFVLWSEVPDKPPVTAKMVQDHFDRASKWKTASRRRNAAGWTKSEAVAYFEWAISQVVDIHLQLCQESLVQTRPSGFEDVFLAEGALAGVVQMAEYLSSGGYKVDQDRVHLGQLVLADELTALGFFRDDGADQAERHARGVIDAFAARLVDPFATSLENPAEGLAATDWLSASGPELRRQLGIGLTTLGRDDKSGAGPMMGLSADSILVEECRRYFFALEWLSVGELVRLSPSDSGKVVALSHDGFGRGLNEWADRNDSRPQTALTRLTESRGEVFEWSAARSEDPRINPLIAPPDEYVRYTNLRWRACRVIGATLKRVVFFGCDFRGTSFTRCSFEGVTFVNCILDGVQLEKCTIVGSPSPLERELDDGIRASRDLPSFIDPEPLDAESGAAGEPLTMSASGQSEFEVYNHYRNYQVDQADVMYSRRAGVESVPARFLDIRTDRVDVFRDGEVQAEDLRVGHVATRKSEDVAVTARWEPQRMGLVMFGGRLSSLAFYACEFIPSAHAPHEVPGVSFRHVAGTSLDFFEHSGGRVELFDAAVRGLTISPIPPSLRDKDQPIAAAHFRALECHLENVWFSTGLHGVASIEKSVIWQLFNGNPPTEAGFRVTLDKSSPFGGVVNVSAVSPFSNLNKKFSHSSLGSVALDDVAQFADAIDYRSPEREQALEDEHGATS